MYGYVLGASITSFFLAQFLKIVFGFFRNKKFELNRFFQAGGMPSSHSALVTSLALCIGLIDGFDSISFAISFVLAVIVMYDAAGVRRAAGQQAKVINQMMELWDEIEYIKDEKLKEILGHTPIEVLGGGVLGCVIALVFSYFFGVI